MDRITVIYPGHHYEIDELDGESKHGIMFVRRGPKHIATPGILIQDLLRVCIDRVQILDKEVNAPENEKVLYHLRMAILFQELRALRRKIELRKIIDVEELPLGKDGHFAIG